MMKFSFARRTVPPDNYRYKHPDGTLIESSDRTAWFQKIEKHHQDNGYPLPVDWKEQAEDQLCRMLPPGWCLHEDGRMEFDGVNTRMEIGDFWRGMDVLRSALVDPEPFVSQEIADQRAAICASCPANIPIPGCHSCLRVANHVLDMKGKHDTTSDHLLKSCGVCRCSNEAQVWVKAKLLAKGVTPDMMRSFALIKECWKGKAINAQDDTAGLPISEATP